MALACVCAPGQLIALGLLVPLPGELGFLRCTEWAGCVKGAGWAGIAQLRTLPAYLGPCCAATSRPVTSGRAQEEQEGIRGDGPLTGWLPG